MTVSDLGDDQWDYWMKVLCSPMHKCAVLYIEGAWLYGRVACLEAHEWHIKLGPQGQGKNTCIVY